MGDLAFARGLNEGFGPDPFFASDRLVSPPHVPMPMHLLPHASPPVPFEGFGPRRHAGFGGRTPLPCKDRRVSLSRPDPKRKVTLPEIEPSGAPENMAFLGIINDGL
ncbi:hypothetical protein ZWY2020_006762 [Hordeum vulgare]|nr:hypothetical protein ZWY2020_006762 [Hordeum vulgare]